MDKVVRADNLWYSVLKGTLQCSETLAAEGDAWRPVFALPRPVFLHLASEFGEAMRSVAIHDVVATGTTVHVAPLEDAASAVEKDKYVTYHIAVIKKID